MKTLNRSTLLIGFLLVAVGIIFSALLGLPIRGLAQPALSNVQTAFLVISLILLLFGGAVIAIGFYSRNHRKYWSIEDMRDNTDFTILHMGIANKDNPDLLRMGISIEGNYFLFQASINNFENKKPEVWSWYTKLQDTFFEK
jgi:hypothetical protein